MDEISLAVDIVFLKRQYSRLSVDDQERIALSNLHYYDSAIYSAPIYEGIRTMFTTSILRAHCGCQDEIIIDELTGEEITISEHGNLCQRIRLPITEDLADSTIARRARKQVALSEVLEDKLHSG